MDRYLIFSNKMKVSIIVPIYNAERYLQECVSSVLCQTHSDWELILIDDGSTDNSSALCDRYAQEDSRIKVVHKVNSGASASKNHGLDMAVGDYVIFLDADDYWLNDSFLSNLVELAEYNDLDIVRGEYQAITEDGLPLFSRVPPQSSLPFTHKVINASSFLENAVRGEYFLVLSLIRRSVLNDVRFNVSRIFLEDMLFYSHIFLKPLRCMYVPDLVFYAYRKHSQSVSNRADFRKIEDSFRMCYEFNGLVKLATDPDVKTHWMHKSLEIYYSTLDTLSLDDYYSSRNEYIKQLDLCHLRRDVLKWMNEYKIRLYSPIYYVHPYWGIYIFRCRHSIGSFIRRLLAR